MADNSNLNPGSGGDVIRSVAKPTIKTQVVTLDLGGAGAESLVAGFIPVSQSGAWSVSLAAGTNVFGALVANQSVNVSQINGIAPSMGNGISGTGVQRVTLASDSTGQVTLAAGANTIGALTANQSVNWTQIGGVAAAVGNGVSGTGVSRVTLASDSTGQVTLAAGANTIGALTANQSVNQAQIAGVATSTGNGVVGTGVQRNAIASDNSAVANWGHGAAGSAVPVNVVFMGLKAATANPANATAGNSVGAMGDKAGRLVTTLGNVRELIGVQTTAIASSSAETTIITAGAAGVFNDISCLVLTNATATAVKATLKDATAGTTRGVFDLAASGTLVIPFPIAMSQAVAANNWTITLSVATVTVDITATFVKNS